MPSRNEEERTADMLREAVRTGTVALPDLLLRWYPRIGLSDVEAMLLLHLLAYIGKERNSFPTIEELQRSMAAPPEDVVGCLRRLVKDGYVRIDEQTEPLSRVRYERYSTEPLESRLIEAWLAGDEERRRPERGARGQAPAAAQRDDIFTIFEKEFARPLTPMELETIAAWIDKDGYKEELIVAALKEAVFSGKVHFRYVDRILLEWARNRVVTAEQAKAHALRYRGK